MEDFGYIDRLIANAQQAKITLPIDEFILEEMEQLKNIKTAIYIIQQVGGDILNTFEKFSAYKKSGQRSCPSLNSPSQVMYVGSSTTGLQKRIDQHIGNGPKKTYALNLKHWFDGEYDIFIKVYDIPRDVLQIIEDDLSERLKPAFGKQGGNNK